MVDICLQIFDFLHKEIFKSVSKRDILPYKVSKIKQWAQPYYDRTHCQTKTTNEKQTIFFSYCSSQLCY